jgi:hypothetical protein
MFSVIFTDRTGAAAQEEQFDFATQTEATEFFTKSATWAINNLNPAIAALQTITLEGPDSRIAEFHLSDYILTPEGEALVNEMIGEG